MVRNILKNLHKNKCLLACEIGALILIGIMCIGTFYTFPCVDDYSFAYMTRNTWVETGSLLDLLNAAKITASEWYLTWQGTFSAIFLMSLQPGIFKENLYFIGGVLIILMHVFSIFNFTKFLLKNCLKLNDDISSILSIITIIISTQFLPSPVQGFYWYNGAMYYTGYFSVFMLTFIKLLNLLKDNKLKWWNAVIISSIAFIIGGGNLPVALLSLELIVLILAISIFKKKRNWKYMLVILIAGGAGLLISAVAPGNQIRSLSYSRSFSPIMAIITSIGYCLYFSIASLNVPIIMLFIISGILIYRHSFIEIKNILFWIITLVIAYLLICSLYTPPIYGMGSPGYGRNKNIVFYCLAILVIFYEVIFINYFRNKINLVNRSCKIIVTICLLIASSYCLIFINTSTSISLLHSYFSGELENYRKIHLERIQLLNSEDSIIVIPELKSFPYAIYFDDLTNSSQDWRNIAIQNYYRKDIIITDAVD